MEKLCCSCIPSKLISKSLTITLLLIIISIFTKSMDSNFRMFWLAPVTWNILGYSLFCKRREKWRFVSRKLQKKKLKKCFFIHRIWWILKQLSPSGSVKSGGYVPRRFASRYIFTTIHLPFGGYLYIIIIISLFRLILCWYSPKRLGHNKIGY